MKKSILALILIIIIQTNYGQLVISEFCTSNYSSVFENDYNQYSDWIEIYNTTNQKIDLQGYYLTDDIEKPDKWKITDPISVNGKSFLVFWADNNDNWFHTNFKIQKETGYIAILDSFLNIIDSVSYSKQRLDISFGRVNNTSDTWVYMSEVTPGKKNSSTYYIEISNNPVFSKKGGLYTSSFTLILNASGTIKYTTDGSIPNKNSTTYTSGILINSTKVIRAIVYENNKLPSDIITNTFIINDPSPLPVVSLSTDPIYLWDDEIGIYTVGTNGISGNCAGESNFNQDWERPVNFEFFDTNGIQQISMPAGIKIAGGCSRTRPQKPVAIIARNQYGNNKIEYRFFNDKAQLDTFKSIFLRNFGNDWDNAIIRDPVMQYIAASKMDIDYQSFLPVRVYLNSEYWGMQAVREKINEHYVANNFNLDVDDVDIFEIWHTSPENIWNSAMHGSAEHYRKLLDFVNTHNLSDNQNYEYILRYIDIDEYINYHIAQIHYANTDWPGNNVKIWRQRYKDGKYRWILFDTDFGMGLYDHSPADETLELATSPNGSGWPNPPYSTLLLRKLLENQNFRNQFINSFMYHIYTTFEPTRISGIIDSFKNDISGELQLHLNKWGLDYYNYENQTNVMKNFAIERIPNMISQLQRYFQLGDPDSLIIINDNPLMGNIFINNQLITEKIYRGNFFTSIPVELKANPFAGYKFDGWYSSVYNSQIIIEKHSEWKYYNKGDEPSGNWKNINYDDSQWNSGYGEFGYGDDDETTVLNYGGDLNNKYISYYFRKAITINDISVIKNATVNILRDDGAVLYINGIEVFRTNMPDGEINYYTTTANAEDEISYFTYNIPVELFTNNINIIAVELHQTSNTSSDISFDLELTIATEEQKSCISNSPVYTPTINQNISLNAKFKEGKKLLITEINYSNNPIYQFIEIKNLTNKAIDLSNYSIHNTTGYIFPNNTFIYPNNYIVLAKDTNSIKNSGSNHLQLTPGFNFSTSGTILLKNHEQNVIDSVKYTNNSPWPVITSTENNSIEINESEIDNSVGQNWHKSLNNTGTPGYKNTLNIKSGQLYINEILTSNTFQYPDEKGRFSDLVEIYNPNDFYVDISGYYFTDTLGLNKLFQLPLNNKDLLIPPKNYLVFWADGNASRGPLHLGFKLNKDGELISLYNRNKELVDRIVYEELLENVSYNRIPDGSNNWRLSGYPTPSYTNLNLNSIPIFTSEPVIEGRVGLPYIYYITAIDLDNSNVIISTVSVPSWLSFIDNGSGKASLYGIYTEKNQKTFDIRLKATDASGMISYQEYTLSIEENHIDALIKNEISETDVLIYPNPSSGGFYIKITNFISDEIDVLMMNIIGKVIYKTKINNNSENSAHLVRLSEYEPGIYIIQIKQGNNNIYKKITLY